MRVSAIALISSVLLATTAAASDHPIAGAELRVNRNARGMERLVFSSRDVLPLPAPGSPDDPVTGSPGGATIELFSRGAVARVAFVAPRDASDYGWRTYTQRYQFGHKAAPDAVSALSTISLHAKRGLRIGGKRAGLALDGHEGGVGIRITLGATRYCALFAPATVKRDQPGSFFAREASAAALADCSDASLVPPPSPTGECGDGVIDPGEQCDGAALGVCGDVGGACGEPGFSNECTCCSANGEMVTLLGCCNPSSVAISYGPAGGGQCTPLRCDAPFTCGSGAECLPSGDCCSLPANPCLFTLTGQALQPCCEGSVCERPDASGFFLTCCVAQGGSCAQDQACCSGSCSGSGTCD
ncbi:hypothetical protein K2Z84_12345 [Candidatus Binatia bacterium]|nr:hypothetical protein [Candidatus Binatia bacterium]